jgi:hypothetical protein
MHSSSTISNETKKYTFIIACLLNLTFLLIIFVIEMNNINVHIGIDRNLQSTASDDATILSISCQDQYAGLMIAGSFDGMDNSGIISAGYVEDSIDTHIEDLQTAGNKQKEESTQITNNSLIMPNTLDIPANTAFQKDEKVQTQSIRKKQVAPSKKKLRKTLQAITQSALALFDSKGNAAINSLGDSNHTPSDLQLIHERYWIKTNHILQKEWSVQQNKRVAITRMMNAAVHIYYSANGFVKKTVMIQSSGSKEVDACIMATFENAYNEFPPIPQRLKNIVESGLRCNLRIFPDGFYVD